MRVLPSDLDKVQALLCDNGYVGKPLAQGVQAILGEHVAVQIAKRSELHTDDPALGGGAQLCVAGEKQATMEELRAAAQYQLAVHPTGISGSAAQKILNTFLMLVTDF